MSNIPTISQQEKDPFKVAAALRQAVEKVNSLQSTLDGGFLITDGDKGDITIGSSGTTFTIDAGAVDAGKLASNAVTTVKITDDNVTNAKLANMAQATVKGRADAAGTGDPTDLSASQLLTIVKTVDGNSSGLDADLWKGATYTVSTSTPSGGADGDFWFEREA